MFKKLTIAGAAFAMTATALVPATPAAAQSRHYSSREYRGESYRHYRARQKCNDGDGGTIIGAVAGGLLGRSIAGGGDRTLGTILGGVGGAVAGRAIDRSDRPAYCRR